MPNGNRPWNGVVTQRDLDVYEAAGFGKPAGLGSAPALLVIDVQYRSVGETPKPILDSINEYATSCGEAGWNAVDHIARLQQIFRSRGFPVIHACVAPKGEHDLGRFAGKVPGVMQIPPRGYEFVKDTAPQRGELVLPKAHASAFFGTPLASHLVNLRVDSLVVTGCTTSGCVRATVVDACQLNYRVAVPHDAVFDRSEVSHAVNLFDMASKYADILSTEEIARSVSATGGPAHSIG